MRNREGPSCFFVNASKNHRKTCTIALKQKIKMQNNIEKIIKAQYNTRLREKTHEKNVISSK